MKFIDELREKPLRTRKMILWIIIIILGLILGLIWLYISYSSVQNLQSTNFIESLNMPNFNQEPLE